jgi:diamine N-acetyltransferase
MEFRDVDSSNWIECIELWTKDDIYVAPNVFSIAEAQFYPKAISKAIYKHDTMVGYALFGEDDADPSLYRIDRLMIAERYRERKLGLQAVLHIIQIAKQAGYLRIESSTELENKPMRSLFEHAGFATDDEMDGDEVIYYKTL